MTLLLFIDMPAPNLVWGLFLRGLGVLYFFAIAQLYHQVLPLSGSHGMTPIAPKLARIRQDYPGWRHWLYFPTLLWINASDRFIKSLILVGAAAALGVVYGGPLSVACLFICWLVYVSLDMAVGFTFPWDCLLLEAGFLGLFLPILPTLPTLAMSDQPLPIVAWAFRWLFFRVLFGFGKYKFLGGSLRDSGYFRSFLVNIPLPTYLAWYAFRLPRWVFQAILLIVFISEIILPFGVFVGGPVRGIVAIVTIFLMIGIQLVSNFGFFNVLTIILCITLFDTQSSLFDTSLATVGAHPITHTIMLVLAFGGLLNLPFNSWCVQTWMHWPSLIRLHVPIVQAILSFYRVLSRFRVVHPYGVFPPQSSPPIRWVPVIEGTQDGVEWKGYEYRFMTTFETTPPRFVAPYHPRFDHAVFYESFGTNDANFIWSTLGVGNPYDFSPFSSLQCLMQRILEGEPEVLSIFRSSPFPANNPPTAVRVSFYRFQPTTLAERRQTGRWWNRTLVSTHLPPTGLDSCVNQQRYRAPEFFHPDAIHWKRRAPRLRAFQLLAQQGPTEQLWSAIDAGLKTNVAVFWNEFVPMIETSGKDWQTLPQTVAHFRNEYDWQQLQDLELILNRLSLALLEKLNPYYLGKAEPQLKVSDYFQLYLLTHHIIGKGRSVYTATLAEPTRATLHLADFEAESSFYYLGIFWFDTLVYQSRKLRLAMEISTVQSGNGLPGFLELIPFISQQFTEISQENLPFLQRDPVNGEWLIREKTPKNESVNESTPVL